MRAGRRLPAGKPLSLHSRPARPRDRCASGVRAALVQDGAHAPGVRLHPAALRVYAQLGGACAGDSRAAPLQAEQPKFRPEKPPVQPLCQISRPRLRQRRAAIPGRGAEVFRDPEQDQGHGVPKQAEANGPAEAPRRGQGDPLPVGGDEEADIAPGVRPKGVVANASADKCLDTGDFRIHFGAADDRGEKL